MFPLEHFEDTAMSARYTRKSSDQGQVAFLKTKAYEAVAEDLMKRYSKFEYAPSLPAVRPSGKEDVDAALRKDGPVCGSQPHTLGNRLKRSSEALVHGRQLVAILQCGGYYPLPITKRSTIPGVNNFSHVRM